MAAPDAGPRLHPRVTILFRLAKVLLAVLLRLLFGFRATGQEHVHAGPAVIVVNHRSAVDPLFFAVGFPERVLFVGAEEYFSWPLVGWAMRAYGCIPVRRGEVDAAAIRLALAALALGTKVALFPEGQISPAAGSPRRGAGLLAARAGAPILPVALCGTGDVFPLGARRPRLARVRMTIGPPLDPPAGERDAQQAAVEAAMAWVFRQADPASRSSCQGSLE